jgi:O-antigen ligase
MFEEAAPASGELNRMNDVLAAAPSLSAISYTSSDEKVFGCPFSPCILHEILSAFFFPLWAKSMSSPFIENE